MTLVYPVRQKHLRTLIKKLGIHDESLVKWDLLDLALTHPSVSGSQNYEQLEFIGDSVIRMAASELLMEMYPQGSVGEFSAIRKILVSDRILASLAESYGLNRYLIVAEGATNDQAGYQGRMADAFEAIVGAFYLSTHDFQLIRPWLDQHFRLLAEEIKSDPAYRNYKDALQEWTQAHYQKLPEYRVREISQENGDPERFLAEVWFNGDFWGTGKGRSKKAAEQAAAQEAFQNHCQPKEAP